MASTTTTYKAPNHVPTGERFLGELFPSLKGGKSQVIDWSSHSGGDGIVFHLKDGTKVWAKHPSGEKGPNELIWLQ